MKRPMSKRGFLFVIAAAVLVASYFIGEKVLSAKLESSIRTEIPPQITLDYQSFELNLLKGQVVLKQIKVLIAKKEEAYDDFELLIEKFSICGFSIWKLLVKNQISIKEIHFLRPEVFYNKRVDKNNDEAAPIKFDKTIKINRFVIENGGVHIYDNSKTDSLLFATSDLNFILKELEADEKSLQKKIPFVYDGYNLSLAALFFRLGEFENLRLEKLQSSPEETSIEGMSIITKISKEELQHSIAVERDYFDVDIPKLNIREQQFGFDEDSMFFFKSKEVHLQSVNMEIYRDKLTADDESHKSLYSKMLRELNISLSLDQVVIENADIAYSEKVNEGTDAGTVSFHKLNAHIQNLGNSYAPKVKTQIDVDAIFMKQTPLEVHWAFDVHNLDDHFIFKAVLGKLPAMDMNPFSEPNLKIKLNGELLKTYFTIEGNHRIGSIDLKTSFSEFEVEVLSKDGKRKNRVLSAIADVFIKNDSDSSEDDFREVSKNEVERDPTKSVFNFLWQNIKSALIGVMT